MYIGYYSGMSTKKTNIPLPLPLFDTLAHLNDEISLDQLPVTLGHEYALFINDYLVTRQFLMEYKGSIDTFNSYRRELERLLQWCLLVRRIPYTELKREDILSFVEFCEHPPSHWIGLNNTAARFIDEDGLRQPNPEWRPFIVRVPKSQQHQTAKTSNFSLSNNAMKAIFRVLSSFFRYLFEEDYIDSNPVAKIRQKSRFIKKTTDARLNRTLSVTQWRYVIDSAEMMAAANPAEHERTLFIMSSLYAMYLRVSELVETPRWSPQMNHFYKDSSSNWWFKTVGKGNKEREITVSDDMLQSLKRYRLSMGLTALPSPQENSPLISKSRGYGGITSTRQIRRIVQECFDYAANKLVSDGLTEESDFLRAATVHWMRHTGISRDVLTRQREHVRDDAGHSSSAITDLYIDIEKKDRHKSGKSKKIMPK